MTEENIQKIKPKNASFYILPERFKQLAELAREDNRSVSKYICMLIEKAIKDKKQEI
jgi:hypothetical protein